MGILHTLVLFWVWTGSLYMQCLAFTWCAAVQKTLQLLALAALLFVGVFQDLPVLLPVPFLCLHLRQVFDSYTASHDSAVRHAAKVRIMRLRSPLSSPLLWAVFDLTVCWGQEGLCAFIVQTVISVVFRSCKINFNSSAQSTHCCLTKDTRGYCLLWISSASTACRAEAWSSCRPS